MVSEFTLTATPTYDRPHFARDTPPDLIEDLSNGNVTEIGRTEHNAFWSWAVIEILRHTGIRNEELLEITHLAPVAYELSKTGEVVPMLQVVPSKNNEERLLLVSPELASVLASIISRLRNESGGNVPLTSRYDRHERVDGPALPHLFQHTEALAAMNMPASDARASGSTYEHVIALPRLRPTSATASTKHEPTAGTARSKACKSAFMPQQPNLPASTERATTLTELGMPIIKGGPAS